MRVKNGGGRHCGYVALVGAPNAGKSTLMNRLMGTKVSIVTPKVQTTRARIVGVVVHGETQIVFVDTPGIFAPRRRLERAGPTLCIHDPPLVTSSRKFAGRSAAAIVWGWLWIHALYHLGVPPDRLARIYYGRNFPAVPFRSQS